MRAWLLILVVLSVLALVLPACMPPNTRIVYNPSASAPLGWYLIQPNASIRPGDYVVARLPLPIAALAQERGYLPAHVPLLKRVAAIGGAAVCVRADVLYIDGEPRVRLLTHDGLGRPLPRWMPCRTLRADELLLLNTEHSASFDSRYFGAVRRASVRGKAVPLWIWREP